MGDVDFKNALLAGDPATAEDELATIPSHAGEITVRPLSRAEVLALNAERAAGMSIAEWEQHLLSKALVHPPMTPGEVATWQSKDKAGGLMENVVDTVTEISGLGKGADKVAYLELARNPDLEFEHYLAVKLGKSVRELRASMSHAEFLRWTMYYARIGQEQELQQRTGG